MSPGALVALVAALAYGAADFCGGVASRRAPATAVLIVSQVAGLVLLSAILPFTHARFYAVDAPLGLGAGAAAAVGIGLLYAALAVGRMGVVSPITAVVGASVPVVAGSIAGERIAPLAVFGCLLALVAIVTISAAPASAPVGELAPALTPRGGRLREPGVALALASGVAIGVVYVMLARGHADGRLAIVAEMRVVSVPLLVLFALVTRRKILPPRDALGMTAAAGVLDMSANALFAIASEYAALAIAAVLTSLYPASTVLLAVIILRERLSRLQLAGLACAAVGVVCIALH